MTDDAKKPGISRREVGQVVIGAATVGYAGAVAYPIVRYLASGAAIADEGSQVSEVSLGNPDDLKPGTGKNFAFGSKPALVVRGKDDKITAFIATCSHLGCTVALDPGSGEIRCPCHGGVYDAATGKNVGGPPPKPLIPLAAVIEGGKLVVRKQGGG
jgi:cytochrome b6-f complex iron-sulfur subunit